MQELQLGILWVLRFWYCPAGQLSHRSGFWVVDDMPTFWPAAQQNIATGELEYDLDAVLAQDGAQKCWCILSA